jgi:uncharacterized protein (DUF1800 family)
MALAALAGCSAPRSIVQGPVRSGPLGSVESRELTADQQVAHALNRLAFGPRPGDLARIRAMGVDKWINEQLDPAQIDDRHASSLIASAFPALEKDAASLMREYPLPNLVQAQARRDGDGMSREDSLRLRDAARASQRIVTELQSAKIARAVASERQLEEVLVDFWENHFSVFIGKNQPMRYYMVSYGRDAIRPHALGKFRELLGAVAKSPAMLVYLDNWQSMADSGRPRLDSRMGPAARRRMAVVQQQRRMRGLNENYARELLELHTLGVDGGYTQQDVIEVARALTGWSLRAPQAGGGFVFRAEMHDAGAKVVLGHRLPAGRGLEDGEDVLDIVSRHPATAHHIALKLARRLVSDSPPAELVDRAAATFRNTDGDIRETVRTIVSSPEFWSTEAWRAKVKSPFETVVSAMRALGAAPDTTPRTAMVVAYLGQPVYGHQAPNGWPETGNEWINTGAILNRINFGLAAAAGRIPGTRIASLPGFAELRTASREAQVDAVGRMLFAGDMSVDTRNVLLRGENPLASGAAEGAASEKADEPPPMMMAEGVPAQRGMAGRAMMLRRPPQLSGLEQIVGLALGAPEFQRR